MRRKYFLISFAALLASTVSIASILLFYFRSERLTFLDGQIRQTATSLIDSKLYALKTFDYKDADAMISEELGPDSVGKFFIVRDNDDKILFQTLNIELTQDVIPTKPQWVTVQTPQHLIRAVNLELPRISGRTMQVGIIVDSDFMSLANVNNRTMIMIAGVFVVILILTSLLSSFLFSPITKLTKYLNEITKSFDHGTELPPMSAALHSQARQDLFSKSDEFQILIGVLGNMVDKLNSNRKFTRSWSFQMAHELKTPLTIVNRDFEVIAERYAVAPELAGDVQRNIDKISETISSFLSWSEVANQKKNENLYVVHISEMMNQLMTNWHKIHEGRIAIDESKNFQVLCNPIHLEQLINNLIENALKYSDGTVRISYADYRFSVLDEGAGIPDEVKNRLGSPFNRGSNSGTKRGVGLGLAWIKTICDLYDWRLTITSGRPIGTEMNVAFKAFESE